MTKGNYRGHTISHRISSESKSGKDFSRSAKGGEGEFRKSKLLNMSGKRGRGAQIHTEKKKKKSSFPERGRSPSMAIMGGRRGKRPGGGIGVTSEIKRGFPIF